MTRNKIISMAREAQRQNFGTNSGLWFSMEAKDLERFAALVAAAERASLVDSEPEPVGQVMYSNGKLYTVTIFDHALENDLPVVPIYARPPIRARREK